MEATVNMLIPIKVHSISKRVEVNTEAKVVAISFRQAEVNQMLKALAAETVATPIHSAQAMSVRAITVVNFNKVPALVRLRKHHIQVNIRDLGNKVERALHFHMIRTHPVKGNQEAEAILRQLHFRTPILVYFHAFSDCS